MSATDCLDLIRICKSKFVLAAETEIGSKLGFPPHMLQTWKCYCDFKTECTTRMCISGQNWMNLRARGRSRVIVMSGKFLMAAKMCATLSLVIKNFIAFCTESCNKHIRFSLFPVVFIPLNH